MVQRTFIVNKWRCTKVRSKHEEYRSPRRAVKSCLRPATSLSGNVRQAAVPEASTIRILELHFVIE